MWLTTEAMSLLEERELKGNRLRVWKIRERVGDWSQVRNLGGVGSGEEQVSHFCECYN